MLQLQLYFDVICVCTFFLSIDPVEFLVTSNDSDYLNFFGIIQDYLMNVITFEAHASTSLSKHTRTIN